MPFTWKSRLSFCLSICLPICLSVCHRHDLCPAYISAWSLDILVGIAASQVLDGTEFEYLWRQEFISSPKSYRRSLGLPQLPIQWVPGFFPPRVNRSVFIVDHQPPSSAEVKNKCSYTSALPISFHCLDRDCFTSV